MALARTLCDQRRTRPGFKHAGLSNGLADFPGTASGRWRGAHWLNAPPDKPSAAAKKRLGRPIAETCHEPMLHRPKALQFIALITGDPGA